MSKLLFTPVWSKRYGIIIEQHQQQYHLYHRPDVQPQPLMSALRVCGANTPLTELSEPQFTEKLVLLLHQSEHEASQVMAGLSDDLDMYQLAEVLPGHEELMKDENNPPIVKLINSILTQALKELASDIHIETFEQRVLIRFRLDGVLHKRLEPDRRLSAVLVSRLKIMARLDIAEKRKPQDGRISLRLLDRAIDVRVSVLPSSHGERIVLRLLDKDAVRLELQRLGMSASLRKQICHLVSKPNGIILVTGPTGSGKSSTLYAMINELDHERLNIMTIEDPVEYDIADISQTQVNPKVEMTFASGLRAILRQDPDVILIGEIRDRETAQIAVQASMTGHLVLSTLHTNTAVGALTRLQDMGVEPFLLASALNAVLAQRLVRRLCQHCRKPIALSRQDCASLGLDWQPDWVVYQAQGCEHCFHTGYHGRTVIQELLTVNEALRSGIHQQKSEGELLDLLGRNQSLRRDGLDKVLKGITSIEEVIRATGEGGEHE